MNSQTERRALAESRLRGEDPRFKVLTIRFSEGPDLLLPALKRSAYSLIDWCRYCEWWSLHEGRSTECEGCENMDGTPVRRRKRRAYICDMQDDYMAYFDYDEYIGHLESSHEMGLETSCFRLD